MKTLLDYAINATGLLFFLSAAVPQRDCRNVRTGSYYFQPRNSTKKFLVIRTDSIQKEVEITTQDTTCWKIKWITDCDFFLEFIRRTNNTSEREKSFYTSHKVMVKILTVTKDYYSFTAGLDSISSSSLTDTLWMKKIK